MKPRLQQRKIERTLERKKINWMKRGSLGKGPQEHSNCNIHPQTKESTLEEGSAAGKLAGHCKAVKRNRQRFHGILGEFEFYKSKMSN